MMFRESCQVKTMLNFQKTLDEEKGTRLLIIANFLSIEEAIKEIWT